MRWTCYLDESGTHAASPILVMGAAVATESQWQIFDRQWEAVLSREQLPYIHYVDFVGRRKKYRKYSTPDIERIGAELAHIAITTAPVTVSSILRFDDYRSIYKVEETLRFNPSSPLGILFRATASVLPSYIVEAGLDDRPEIDFVYEAGAPNEGDIRGRAALVCEPVASRETMLVAGVYGYSEIACLTRSGSSEPPATQLPVPSALE